LDDDMDGDGYSNEEELAYPSNPRDSNSVANALPQDLGFMAPLSVLENKAPGSPVGKLMGEGASPDGESITYELVEGEGAEHNALFILEANGLLWANESFDYEAGLATYFIRARASTSQQESVQVFAVHLLDDPYENTPYDSEQGSIVAAGGETNSTDYDQYDMVDPVAGWADANETEQYAGNLASSDINLTIDDGLRIYAALTIPENEPVGAMVGEFSAFDEDDWATLSYAFADGEGDEDNQLFDLDESGVLRAAKTFDYEGDQSEYSIRVRVSDERNTFTEESFIIYLLDVDDTPPVITLNGEAVVAHILGTSYEDAGAIWVDNFDGNGSLAGVGKVEVMVPGTYTLHYNYTDLAGNLAAPVFREVNVINRAPNALFLSNDQVLENGPVGEIIGVFTARDPDDVNGSRPYLFELVSQSNTSESLFDLESNGTLKIGGSIDFEDQHMHLLRVRVSDEYGASYEQEFEVRVLDVHTPIIDTLQIEEYENGGFNIGGELVIDADRIEQSEFGVLVSDRPILSRVQPGVFDYSLQLDKQTLKFSRFYGPDVTWKRLYVRAYAHNEEGTNYGLEERVKLNLARKTQDVWSGATRLSGAEGWWQSEWFGVYFKSEQSGWILHTELGWLYPSPSLHAGIWIWKEGLGWLWSDEQVYPYLYSADSGSWLYFFGQSRQQRLLYDYGLGKWLRLNEFGVLETEGAR
jgi:hypothetical protein